MKVDELKAELDRRGISNKGKKDFLREKLRKAMKDKIRNITKKTCAVAPNGFVTKAQWYLIDDSRLPTLQEAQEEFEGSYAPSDRTGMVARARKYNYTENWKRDEFNGVAMQPTKDKEGIFVRTRQGGIKYKAQPIRTLTPNYKFVKEHRLDRYKHLFCVPIYIFFSYFFLFLQKYCNSC